MPSVQALSALVAFLAPWLCYASAYDDGQAQMPLFGAMDDIVAQSTTKPNIVFILTDDQDLHLQSLDYLPLIKKHLLDEGTFYRKHFCTVALCCPSRVSLWTGKTAHNTNVTDVNPPYGGYPKFVNQGLNENYLPVWLQNEGYNTYYTGKLFNSHTVHNYHLPYAAGWTGSDFLLDPFTYSYLNSTYQRNRDPPVSHEGEYTVDVLASKTYGFLDDAVQSVKPFFLGVAPIAPHSNVDINSFINKAPLFSEPVPAERHEHLFADVKIPRTQNFNPDEPSGVSWVRTLPKQSQENVDFNDHFYRQRLRSLQSVDELVDGLVTRLDAYGILGNTWIFYTSDNGFHIGQHRLQPGKECGFEEDINIPLIVRGPGVPRNHTTDIVTTHTDLAPTIMDLVGSQSSTGEGFDFDGKAVPLTRDGIALASKTRHEHVNVEYWGFALTEGRKYPGQQIHYHNNTYKALRVFSDTWNLYYSVWCSGEHELYDLSTDPGQLHNILGTEENTRYSTTIILQGFPLDKVAARLDSLLFVLKSCKRDTCVYPWRALHPAGNVENLQDALSPRFDHFYLSKQKRVEYSRCENGYILDAEGPQFETDGLVYKHGAQWSEWV